LLFCFGFRPPWRLGVEHLRPSAGVGACLLGASFSSSSGGRSCCWGASPGQAISTNKAVFLSLSFSALLRRDVGWWSCALRGWLPWRKFVADSSVPAQFNKCHICLIQLCGVAAWSFSLSCRGGEGMEWPVAADGGAGEGREEDNTASGRRRFSVAQVWPSTEEAGGQLLRDLTPSRQVIFNLHWRPWFRPRCLCGGTSLEATSSAATTNLAKDSIVFPFLCLGSVLEKSGT